MKKRFLALLCALTVLLGALPAASALEGEAHRAAGTLAELGLVNGYGGDAYALEAPATRTHAAVLLARLSGASAAEQAAAPAAGFRDAPAWAAQAINYAKAQNWVTGVTSKSFGPEKPLTANAWCAMLLRMLGYSDQAGDFTVDSAALFAWRTGLTSRLYEGQLTRGGLFQIMADALTFSYRDGGGTVVEKLVAAGFCTRKEAKALGLLDTELTARQVADRCTAAVGSLRTFSDHLTYEEGIPSGDSSLFFISPDGLAVTCYHSIEGAAYANVTLVTGETYPVEKVIAYDPATDMAVLRVSSTSVEGVKTSAFAHLRVAGKQDIRPGDVIYALGNPLGTGLAISDGIISATERKVDRYAQPCILNTASISQGSSGGALLNAYGHVIAITTGAYVYGNDMYLAIPADPVLDVDLTAPGMTLEEVSKAEADRASK